MASDAVVVKRSAGRKLAGLFNGRPRLQVGALLAAPTAWLVILYLGSLVILLVTAFWSVDPLSGNVLKEFNLENFEDLVNEPVYREIVWRTVRTAVFVTLTDALIAATRPLSMEGIDEIEDEPAESAADEEVN